MKILFNTPYLTGNEEKYVTESIRSKRHCGNLSFTKKCTDFIEKKYNVKKAFLTPSCTAALEMAAILIGLGPGDEVILPSYTFSSTANAICLQGASPVFVDLNPKTFNIDEDKIEAAITNKTKAIFPIDYGGVSPDMDKIMTIANKYNLIVVEDAAQGMEAKYKGRYVGSVPHMATFSFHETKNYTCGEGGALLINDESLIQKAEFIQEKGTDRSLVVSGVKSKYSWVTLGSSFLLSDILSAFLYAQLEEIESITASRKILYDKYYEVLTPYVSKGRFGIQEIPKYCEINYHGFYITFKNETEKDKFIALMKERNIYAYIGYLPLHSSTKGQTYGYKKEDLPVTTDIAKRIVRLPLWAGMTEEEMNYTITNLKEILEELER